MNTIYPFHEIVEAAMLMANTAVCGDAVLGSGAFKASVMSGSGDSVSIAPGTACVGGRIVESTEGWSCTVTEPTTGTATLWLVMDETGEGEPLHIVAAVEEPSVPHIKLAELTVESGKITGLIDKRVIAHSLTELSNVLSPKNYGVGTMAGQVCEDVDTALSGGVYIVGERTLHTPSTAAYGELVVLPRGGTSHPTSEGCKQLLFASTQKDETGGYILRRSLYANEWQPWEYLTPPMQMGVEYRTTERYNGKPVYVKLLDFGALPNADFKYIDHGITGMDACVDVEGVAISGVWTYSLVMLPGNNSISVSDTEVAISTDDDYSTMKARITLKYTKA